MAVVSESTIVKLWDMMRLKDMRIHRAVLIRNSTNKIPNRGVYPRFHDISIGGTWNEHRNIKLL